jgi:PD-(D/E)XK nuclease superfamily
VLDYPVILKSVIAVLQKGGFDEYLANVDVIIPFPLDLKGMETTFVEVLEEKTRVFAPESRTQAFLAKSPSSCHNLSAFKQSIQAYLAKVPAGTPAKYSESDKSFNLRACLTVDRTISEFFHWLSEAGVNIGDAALVSPNYDSYAGPLYRFCQKHDIALNLSNGLLASEFAFFAEDLAHIESLSLAEAQSYFRNRVCTHESYESLRTQALGFIHSYLAAQKAFESVVVSPTHGLDLLRQHLLSVRLPMSAIGLDRQGLFFGRPQDLIGCQIGHLGIVGLQDHNYPAKIVPDPILTDSERAALNERLESGAHHHELRLANPTELQKDLLEKISLSAEHSLFLAFESHDLGSGGRSLPSSFLNRVLSAFGLEMSAEALYEAAGKIPESFFAHSAANNLMVSYDEHLASAGQVGPTFTKWAEVLSRRQSFSRNQEDGVTLSGAQDKALTGEYSASKIADFFKCPYLFYLKTIAGVKEIETQARAELQWLDHMNRGTFIHAVFEGWVEAYLKNEPSAKAWARFLNDEAPKLLESLLVTAGSDFEAEKQGVPQIIIDAEIADMRELCLEFIKRELQEVEVTGFYPIRAEQKFDKLTYVFTPAGARKEVSITFKGIVDRIDTDGKGTYRVVDWQKSLQRFGELI